MFAHRLSFLILTVLLFGSIANAQEAYKIGDVTRLRCDIGEIAQLDYMAIDVEKKDAKGVIIVYGNMRGKATRYAAYVKNMLVNFRRMNPQSLLAYYGGYSEKPKMEIWVVPKGAKEPQINPVINESAATKFDAYSYFFEYCPDEREPALKIFAEELKQNQNLTGYIIVYYDKDKSEAMYSSVHRGQRASVMDKKFLTKLGISGSRIFTIDADYKKTSYANHAELWIVPQGSSPAKADFNKQVFNRKLI